MKGGAKIKVRSQLRKGWAQGSPSIHGSESAGETLRVCAEGVCAP